MANNIIKPSDLVKNIKASAHKAAMKHNLSKKVESRLLIAVCASIGRSK